MVAASGTQQNASVSLEVNSYRKWRASTAVRYHRRTNIGVRLCRHRIHARHL